MEELRKYTVLIVDDDDTLRNSMVFDFKRKGFTVLEAKCGSDAFEIVKNNKIHLVISDMRMPQGDGMSLLEDIRVLDPSTPTVIFVTGFAFVTEAEALALGAWKVFPKPFDRNQLLDSAFAALGIAAPERAA